MISRGKGQSAVASSSYRAGEKLIDHDTGVIHDFTRKKGVVYSEVLLPEHAPKEYQNRELLWNSVQEIEKQSNAQLAREIEVALPVELDRQQQIKVLRQYIRLNFIHEGMCADWALHDKGDGNPHAHIMLTTRPIKENGTWGAKERKAYSLDENGEKIPVIDPETGEQKIGARGRKIWKRELIEKTGWTKKENAEIWRANWAKTCNQYLSQDLQIDHRSYERQGVEQLPTQHEGYAARQMEQKGQRADRCEINREIQKKNKMIANINQQIVAMNERSKKIQAEIGQNAPVTTNKEIPRVIDEKTKKLAEIKRKQAENERKYTDLQHRQTILELQQKIVLPWDTEIINKAMLYYEHAESDVFREYQSAPRFGKRSKKNLLDRNKNMDYYKIKYALDTKEWFDKNNIPLPTKQELRQTLEYKREKRALEEKMKLVKREMNELRREESRMNESAEPPNFRTFHEERVKQEKQREALSFKLAPESNPEKSPKKKSRDRSR